jgi:PhnB protein
LPAAEHNSYINLIWSPSRDSTEKEDLVQLNAYLNFNGNCEEAVKFYATLLNGKIDGMMTYAGSPMEKHVPADWQNKVLHTTLCFGDQVLMASDVPAQHYLKPQGFSIAINLKDAAEADRIFSGLSEGGNVRMPLQKTFWASRFGEVTDRFGTPWLVNCE